VEVNGETGNVLWSRFIAEYNGIVNSISRTSPAYAEGMVFVGDLNGNMMAVDGRPEISSGSRSSIPTRTRS
jgi:hypothetical protein